MATFGFNYVLKPPPELFTVAQKVSWGILAHSHLRDFFEALVLSWADVQASFSKMDQTQKSRGFKSSDEGAIILSSRKSERTLTPVLGFVCSLRGCTVLLECERVIFKMFLHFNMGWSQNILNV